MTLRWMHLLLLAGSLLTLSGCQACGRKKCCQPVPPPPCGGGPLPPRIGTAGPPPVSLTAPPAQPTFPGAAPPPPGAFPPSPPPNSANYYGVPPQSPAPAAPSDVRLTPPETAGPAVTENRVSPSPSPSPLLPVGIPQFYQVQPRLAGGLKPDGEGLDWLRANGYQTVLHVRAFDEDDSAEQREVERRGMKFISMISDRVPTQVQMEAFNRLLQDSAAQPLFVYDRDGMLAGGLWYQYFRQVLGLSEDEARTRATRLGWK
ncbi:MAG: hypothetical protein JNM56_16855 [Planctomycetia bacterium]|nr:hypothetical protein [Planctomycetia bacterium]